MTYQRLTNRLRRKPVEEAPMLDPNQPTIADLNRRLWYRLFKVLYIALWGFVLFLLFVWMLISGTVLSDESDVFMIVLIIIAHCCPVKSRIGSIGWGHRGIRFGSRMAGVPVKRAFFRIA